MEEVKLTFLEKNIGENPTALEVSKDLLNITFEKTGV